MKRCFIIFLILLLLVPTANAATTEDTYQNSYESSSWAQKDIDKALDLGISCTDGDYRLPIERGDFARSAASLVAIEFGSHLESYLLIMNYRGQAERGESFYLSTLDVANNLGIIEGRGEDDWDADSSITRQEAAVMLARTYRAYHGNVPDTLQPLSFADQGDIADWAMDDVRLMNQLGIMTGTEDNRFDPLGSYTSEQCLVTLMRLHEKCPYDGSKQENPFAIPVMEGGFMKTYHNSILVFAIETDDYYICSYNSTIGSGLGYQHYSIDIIGPDFLLRSYRVPILEEGTPRGGYYARPENPNISEDGTKLIYNATVEADAYSKYYDSDGNIEETLLFPKGIYTVTMDLATGEQTYTRADLPES